MRLDCVDGDTDWLKDPWFLRPSSREEQEWLRLGLSLELRKRAVEGLHRIFPPEICREIRDDISFQKYGPALGLFDDICLPALTAPLLYLGIDSILAKPWEDRSVLSRLRQRGNHEEAAFEVRIHAALVRSGYVVSRVSERSATRSCDFVVRKNASAFEIEVKLLNCSDFDLFARGLGRTLITSGVAVPGMYLALHGSRELAEQAFDNIEMVQKQVPNIANAFMTVASLIGQDPAPGTYPVKGYGQIVAELDDGPGSVTDLVLPELSEEKKAIRALRILRKGMTQLTGKKPGVIVVGLFHLAQPHLVEDLVVYSAREDNTFARSKMVVLCDSIDMPSKGSLRKAATPAFYVFSPNAYRRVRPRELELAAALSGTHGRDAVRLWRARPGGISVSLDTSRSVQSTINLDGDVLAKELPVSFG